MTEKPKKSALNQNEPRLDLNYQFEELDNKQNKTVRITTQSANRKKSSKAVTALVQENNEIKDENFMTKYRAEQGIKEHDFFQQRVALAFSESTQAEVKKFNDSQHKLFLILFSVAATLVLAYYMLAWF